MTYSTTIDDIKEFEKFSDNAKKIIVLAFEELRNEGGINMKPRHLFLAILKSPKSIASRLLEKLGVDVDKTIESLEIISKSKGSNSQQKMSEEVKAIVVGAATLANSFGHVYVGSEHILLAILKNSEIDFVKDFEKVGLTYDTVLSSLRNFATYHHGVFEKETNYDSRKGEKGKSNLLNAFTQNMNELAKQGKYLPIYGRNEEIERAIHILSRKTKSNPILVGEAGVGKTAIIEGLVQRIVNKTVPISFQSKKIINLDVAGIIAGSKIRGDVEERILGIIKEASIDPDIILFIDEVHMIIGAGSAGQGSMDIANILKPYLTSGDISVIGATTYDEYQKYFESDSALTRRFQSIFVDEIGVEEAIKVMQNIAPKLEDYHNVTITEDAILTAVKLSDRYVADRFLPDKAIDIIDEAAAGQKIAKEGGKNSSLEIREEYNKVKKQKNDALERGEIEKAAKLRKEEVDLNNKIEDLLKKEDKKKKAKFIVNEDKVRQVISKLAKIPVEKLDKGVIKSLTKIADVLEKKVVGQPDAIKKVASAIKRARVGIGDQNRPLASFLFLGPTGVGKTELAKSLAIELFGHEQNLIQVDMSEYMEQHSVSKLIGSPPGYVGFQEGGQLTEKIRRNPYSVVLLDEIEKAHGDLLNIFLQVLEEGSIQDSKGRKISFRNTIIIMTSNIGADEVVEDNVLGFNVDSDKDNDPDEKEMDKAFEQMRKKLIEELKNTLRPELLNRIDEVVVFRGLADSDIEEIVILEIEKLNRRLAEKNLSIKANKNIIKYIVEEGWSEEYGARNVRRKVQELIENPLAELILEENLHDVDKKIVVNANKNKNGVSLTVKKK